VTSPNWPPTHLGFGQFRVAGEDWGAAIGYAVAAFHRPRVQQLVFQENAPARIASRPGIARWRTRSLARRRRRAHRLALQLLQLAERARAAAGRAGTAVLDMVRPTPDVGPQRAGRGGHRRNSALGRAAGRHQGHLEMYRARQTDAEQNRPHYADPISCPVLAVGAQAYLGDEVSRQLAHVARDVRGAVIPASGHNIALENPAALAQAYLDFFAGG
jgi:pimeloyl-ACP methyl ester carboxylesterase